jgi:hypothetical protein
MKLNDLIKNLDRIIYFKKDKLNKNLIVYFQNLSLGCVKDKNVHISKKYLKKRSKIYEKLFLTFYFGSYEFPLWYNF